MLDIGNQWFKVPFFALRASQGKQGSKIKDFTMRVAWFCYVLLHWREYIFEMTSKQISIFHQRPPYGIEKLPVART